MSYQTVRTDSQEHIGELVLDRPEELNTFSLQLAQDLNDALLAFEQDPTIRVIIIRGAGDAFSAGIDVSEHAEYGTRAGYQQWVNAMERPFVTLTEMGTPTIAAAHGHAVANGLGLLAACDLAVLAKGTRLGATAPKLGLFCMGPAVPLMRSLTEKRCLELLLTGDMITAETAYDWGLANRLVPEEELFETAVNLADSIAENSPVAVQRGKQAYYTMADMDYEAAIPYSNREFAALCATDDAADGIAAFLAGETPNWD